jgi:hypothetical protein
MEVIKKNTCFQYERSLAAWSVAIFIALTKSVSKRNRRENAGGNDVAIFSGMKKWRQKSGCAAIFGNTEVKNRCCCIAIGILTLQLFVVR